MHLREAASFFNRVEWASNVVIVQATRHLMSGLPARASRDAIDDTHGGHACHRLPTRAFCVLSPVYVRIISPTHDCRHEVIDWVSSAFGLSSSRPRLGVLPSFSHAPFWIGTTKGGA